MIAGDDGRLTMELVPTAHGGCAGSLSNTFHSRGECGVGSGQMVLSTDAASAL
jgi:hypothetical protein